MSSGFSGGYPDMFNGINNVSRSSYNHPRSYMSPLEGILSESLLPAVGSRSSFKGKRSLSEFQQQRQQQSLVYLRNVKPRAYNYISRSFNNSNNINDNKMISNYGGKQAVVNKEMERKMLRELEKELLLDDGEENDDVSVVTDNKLTETITKLLNSGQGKKTENKYSPSSTTSSSSSCASSSATVSLRQLVTDAAEAITDGKLDTAMELVTRLEQYSNARGVPEQRIGCYIAFALRSRLRVDSTVEGHSSSMNELYKKDHILSTQLLYDKSPFFKLAFMAANNLIMQSFSGFGSGSGSGSCLGQHAKKTNIHVVDFDIGHGLQYVYLIHEIAAARRLSNSNGNSNSNRMPVMLKVTTFKDFGNGGVERLKLVGDGLKSLANKLGVWLSYNVLEFKLCKVSNEGLAVTKDDVLAANFAFKLNKFPDESVSTENLRDAILRRVKGMSPAVVTVGENELNTNTASFTARVKDVFGYYTTFVESLDATVSRESVERVKIEEGLTRRIVNSVACEGRERVERCEVFGKWRARLRMAGFEQKPVSRVMVDSLTSKVNSGTRGNPGISVKEDLGGVSFGWLGKTLTTVSAWQ